MISNDSSGTLLAYLYSLEIYYPPLFFCVSPLANTFVTHFNSAATIGNFKYFKLVIYKSCLNDGIGSESMCYK